MSPKSGSGGSGQMRMRGQDHSLTEVLSHLQPSEHTPAQGLRGLRSTGLKDGEGLTFSPLALSRHSLAISGETATPGKGGSLWPCPGWPFSRSEELRGLLLVVGCATVALVAQALLSSRGLPLGITWRLASCLGHGLPLGSPASSPAPGLRGPLGRAEPHGGCHLLLSSGKCTCPHGYWGQVPALRGWRGGCPASLATGLSWAAMSGKGVPGGIFLPLLFGPSPVSYGALTGRPWRLQRAVASPSYPPPPLAPRSGPRTPSMHVPQGLASGALGPGTPGKHTHGQQRLRKYL